MQTLPEPAPTALVANLPYNVSVPVLITFLERFPSIEKFLVMVQAEVADRIVAKPGNKTYGIPSLKMAWFGNAVRAGSVGRNVFWPAPNVDSALVYFQRHSSEENLPLHLKEKTFAIVDAAFAQRRKTLRAALNGQLQGKATEVLELAGVPGNKRGEELDIAQFLAIAKAALQLLPAAN